MGLSTDIDIDFLDRDHAVRDLKHVPAAIETQGARVKHNTGVYFQNIPVDPLDGFAVYDHKEAGRLGYFKIDMLNNSLYEGVRDEADLDRLLAIEPQWDLLDDERILSRLAQIREYGDVIRHIVPRSIEDLAVCIALLRPGKKHLIPCTRAVIDAEIWQPSDKGYSFKKSHAIAYAASIVVQLNLMTERLLSGEMEL